MALAENISAREDQSDDRQEADVVLGDAFIAPDSTVEKELRDSRARRSLFSLNRSPLTRKIITFNLIALNVLVAGILWLNSSRDTLVLQRGNAVSAEAELVADALEARLPAAGKGVRLEVGWCVAATASALASRNGTLLPTEPISTERISAR